MFVEGAKNGNYRSVSIAHSLRGAFFWEGRHPLSRVLDYLLDDLFIFCHQTRNNHQIFKLLSYIKVLALLKPQYNNNTFENYYSPIQSVHVWVMIRTHSMGSNMHEPHNVFFLLIISTLKLFVYQILHNFSSLI